MSNMWSGGIYAAFGTILLILSMLCGSLIDRIMLRRTLQLQLLLTTAATLLLSLSTNVWWTCIVLFAPLSLSLAIGLPAIPVAVRRYTTASSQMMGFGILYVVMNIGTAAAQVTADLFRIYILPLDRTAALGFMPAYSLMLGLMTLPHFCNLVLVTVLVRDVYVVNESWETRPTKQITKPDIKPITILRQPKFWKFVLLSLGTTGAKSIYRYLDSLYPLYMRRAPFVPSTENVPYMTFLLINPALACVLTPVASALAVRYNVHPFDLILLGCLVSAGAPFFMIATQYWAVILFVLVLTVGESIWAPSLQKYTNDFCEPGTEGMFYALSTIPLFAAKIISGSLTGILLEHFCKADGDCLEGWTIWLIIGCITVSSPFLLAVTFRWTRIPVGAQENRAPDN